jgi:hypothetical protein
MAKSFDGLVTRTTSKKARLRAARRTEELLRELPSDNSRDAKTAGTRKKPLSR